MFSVALSGLSFVNTLVPGVTTPVCSLSRLDFVDLWFGAFPQKAIKNKSSIHIHALNASHRGRQIGTRT